jgi:hypothetical protein
MSTVSNHSRLAAVPLDMNGVKWQGAGNAEQLAQTLANPLEAIANLHYLQDAHIDSPSRLRELRRQEEEIFQGVLLLVQRHIATQTFD